MRFMCVVQLGIAIAATTILSGCSSVSRPGTKQDGLFGLRRAGDRVQDPSELLDPLGERSVDRLLLSDFSPSNIGDTLKSRMGMRDPGEAEQTYQQAQQVYAQAVAAMEANPSGQTHVDKFSEAARLFRSAASLAPESAMEEEALFFEGEASFHANRYVEANRAYEKLIALYSGTRYLDKAERNRFAIAQYWLQLAEKDSGFQLGDPKRPTTSLAMEARRIFHRIRIDDPTGKLADDATMALGMAYFHAGKYYEAADAYADLRQNYPGSEHQFLAHLYELKSCLKSYRGGHYDSQPLDRADKLLKTIVTQFPDQAQEEKEFLAVEATRIRNMLAERDLSMAEYFEHRGENRAAGVYFREVAENFTDTELAETASQRLGRLDGKPPVPEQKLKWLVDMLPDPNAEKPILNASMQEKLMR